MPNNSTNKNSILKNLTKGRTLEKLSNALSGNNFKVPTLYNLAVDQWSSNSSEVYSQILKIFKTSDELVVRSSASDEDSNLSTKAGEYDSVLGVSVTDKEALSVAITKVLHSYDSKGVGSAGQEILIQQMVTDVDCSGVIFTHELNSGAPYFVINYDDLSGSTNSVTSGSNEYSNRTLYIHRTSLDKIKSERFQALISAVSEVEEILGCDFLDIEFAIDKQLRPHLLQVRQITMQSNWNRAIVRTINNELDGISSFVSNGLLPQTFVNGKTTVYGQMPDWNPAEMIGRAPRALSFSLYRKLITDGAWSQARKLMGYSIPVGQPLMISLGGQPYIDTRLSFHSYLPSNLPDQIGIKLVDEWVERLKQRPELHDKVEFDVAVTTYTFDIDEKLDHLATSLDSEEKEVLKTNLLGILHPLLRGESKGSIGNAIKQINKLYETPLPELDCGVSVLFKLIDECVNLGTIPFSILARHGFIARSLLLSLKSRGVFNDSDIESLLAGIKTIASEMLEDMHALKSDELSIDSFMLKYGHLRPGTYDILSQRYDQTAGFKISVNEGDRKSDKVVPGLKLSDGQENKIYQLLNECGLEGVTPQSLLKYISDAVSGREYGKFVFTRTVSVMLEIIAKFGEKNKLSREEMSHIPIWDILNLGVESNSSNIEEKLRSISHNNSSRHSMTTALRLPQILSDTEGVYIIPFQVSLPNFITSKKITAESIYMGPHQVVSDLRDKIILIENADPGYDWIFAQSIKGLITKFGGANSHMAIRCAEFGIPAAIGCGEQRFDRLVMASHVSLDCATGTINSVNLNS